MIRNRAEYKEALRRCREEVARLEIYKKWLTDAGLIPIHIEALIEPIRAFFLQHKEEVEDYERRECGDIGGAETEQEKKIEEQEKQIEEQEKQIEEQETKIAQLEKRVAELEDVLGWFLKVIEGVGGR